MRIVSTLLAYISNPFFLIFSWGLFPDQPLHICNLLFLILSWELFPHVGLATSAIFFAPWYKVRKEGDRINVVVFLCRSNIGQFSQHCFFLTEGLEIKRQNSLGYNGLKKHKLRKDWKSDKCPQWMNIAWTVSIGHNDGYAEIYEDD